MSPTPTPDIQAVSGDELARGLSVARKQRVAVFVVAYNAESHIRETLGDRRVRPPARVHGHLRQRGVPGCPADPVVALYTD